MNVAATETPRPGLAFFGAAGRAEKETNRCDTAKLKRWY